MQITAFDFIGVATLSGMETLKLIPQYWQVLTITELTNASFPGVDNNEGVIVIPSNDSLGLTKR